MLSVNHCHCFHFCSPSLNKYHRCLYFHSLTWLGYQLGMILWPSQSHHQLSSHDCLYPPFEHDLQILAMELYLSDCKTSDSQQRGRKERSIIMYSSRSRINSSFGSHYHFYLLFVLHAGLYSAKILFLALHWQSFVLYKLSASWMGVI